MCVLGVKTWVDGKSVFALGLVDDKGMDQHTQYSCFLFEEDDAPLSPKRPRTDCTIANKHSGKSKFRHPTTVEFPEHCRFHVTSV